MSPCGNHGLPLDARLLPGVDLSLWFSLLATVLVVQGGRRAPLLVLLRQ